MIPDLARPALRPSKGVIAPAIEVSGLEKRFGAVVAVAGLDFVVPRDRTVALLGPNGAGKTTTIAMLLGLLEPDRGTIRLLGHEIPKSRYSVLPRVNFSSPYLDLPLRLTVRRNLRVYADLYGLEEPAQRIKQLAAMLDLDDLLDRPVGKLSAGQKTRVHLAKALINDPELLFLDEPTASLDPDSADRLRGHLERWRAARGATIFLASHNMAEVERLADEVLLMKQGRLIDRGSPHELLARYGRRTLEEVFLDVARNRRQW